MNLLRSTAWLVALAVATGACGIGTETDSTSADVASAVDSTGPTTTTSTIPDPFDAALANWEELATDDYLVTVTDEDESLQGGCIWRTEVHPTSIDLRWTSNFDHDCHDWDVSVPALHQKIAELQTEANNTGADLIVEWAGNGVPSRIDFIPNESGDEPISVTIEFEDLTGGSSIRNQLAEARTNWSAARVRNYQLGLFSTDHAWPEGCQWNNTVTNGLVAETSVDAPSASSLCAVNDGTTVEELHDLICRWADEIDQYSDPGYGEHTLDITFEEHGVPTTLVYDLANGYHEETNLQVTFTPLP